MYHVITPSFAASDTLWLHCAANDRGGLDFDGTKVHHTTLVLSVSVVSMNAMVFIIVLTFRSTFTLPTQSQHFDKGERNDSR